MVWWLINSAAVSCTAWFFIINPFSDSGLLLFEQFCHSSLLNLAPLSTWDAVMTVSFSQLVTIPWLFNLLVATKWISGLCLSGCIDWSSGIILTHSDSQNFFKLPTNLSSCSPNIEWHSPEIIRLEETTLLDDWSYIGLDNYHPNLL